MMTVYIKQKHLCVLVGQECEGEDGEEAKPSLDLQTDQAVEQDQLKQVLFAAGTETQFGSTPNPQVDAREEHQIPMTLNEALARCAGMSSEQVVFDQLWRLCMSLRHWFGGCDKHWIRNASASRVASTSMTWHKLLN